MPSQYDAIFKYIMNNKESKFVAHVTGSRRGRSLSNDAGWHTARTVDYVARVSDTLYTHIEIQTNIDTTMHWRMVNYYTLLNHKIHGWEDDGITIQQFLVYIGPGSNSMPKEHLKFGPPYRYTTVELSKQAPGPLVRSPYYGDRLISLLMAGATQERWLSAFNAICTMQNEARKLEALFVLLQFSALRGMKDMIEKAIIEVGMFEALHGTRLTAWAANQAAIDTVIDLMSDYFHNKGERPVSDEEADILRGLDYDQAKRIYNAIAFNGNSRSFIVAGAIVHKGSEPTA
ncbi:hypothetical protein [Rhizobium leguminosarum]|uniref:hypothetical protein n=1 Tax=Rhizobium leguminosarum TaxID=384 RepID=UPI00103D3F0F|nr:hypothetical protein [Rhizobium leguminosarum]TBZ96275.1 hypothetical protein E0H57_32465 [Rhizobium leguminosarum bv. viciae]